jgi:hypothetical protein
MDNKDKLKLLEHVAEFAHTAPGGTHRTLQEFQQFTGWINWVLNVFLWLKLALSNVYEKISSKSNSHAIIYISKAVLDDLKSFRQYVETSSDICVFKATDWLIEETDLTAYGDASTVGMGFYFHELSRGFQSTLPHGPPKDVIFYLQL